MRLLGAYPVAYPFALSSNEGSYLQSGVLGARSGDDSLSLVSDTTRDSKRGGHVSTHDICTRLSEREIAVLQDVERFRFMSARQIERLHFFDHASPLTAARTCRRVLRRLTRDKVVWRLGRRVGGLRAGSSSYVYGLAPLGYRALHHAEGKRVRRSEPSPVFVDHTLAVAQIVVDLHSHARSGAIEVLSADAEPECWRRVSLGLEGELVLKPDLYVALSSDQFEYHWFVEVDLATHSAASVMRKCDLYQRHWATGSEQEKNGLFPQVLLVAPSERRANGLKRALDAARGLNRDLFAVTETKDALTHLCRGTS